MYGMPSAWRVPGYTEIRELGAGAAGRVVMARHDAEGALVAIKYLSDELRGDAVFAARFRHEARLLHRLNGSNAVRLYDYVETSEGAAIVMELVDGVSLRAILRSEGPTGPEAALVVLKGSLLGLAAAHRAGIVHRDFKPENVMVDGDGTSKLVDFGIALPSGDGGAPAGTPPYMAPEQWTGAPASPATDVYAATVVFFECLTGARPFRAQTVAALARQHQTLDPPVEEVPPALQGLVERGLAKNPADRPPTATAFLTELEAVAADAYGPDWQERGRRRLSGLAALLASLFPHQPETPETDTSLAETDLGDGDESLLGRLGVKIAIGVACIAVITGVAVVLVGSGDDPVLQSHSSVTAPSDPPSDSVGSPEPEEPAETEEPAEPAPDGTATTPAPTPTGTATPPPVAPTTATSAPAAPSSAPPSRTPSAAPTRRTAPATTDPAASEQDGEEDEGSESDGPESVSDGPARTTSAPPTAPAQTTAPSTAPSTAPPASPDTTPGGDGGSTPATTPASPDPVPR
ncbi:serine/threonine-protein kinase [Planomonospora sp. ID82291]|uniref:serine/threonine-protein kinase n=1 Tax=Planomonospora sp. ID82291 TaxID=2738136 RepID=UPI0018C41683|nr:serine/threonine-protein kinase [Planomonospora sp. ID82291]MBG0815613.1 protein kinase [Planomonospora sp. ID82291]